MLKDFLNGFSSRLAGFKACMKAKEKGKSTLEDIAHMEIGERSQINRQKVRAKSGCSLDVGSDSIIEGSVVYDKEDSAVTIGSRTFIGGGSVLVCADQVDIGSDVLISWGCTIVDHNSHAIAWEHRKNDVVEWAQKRKDWTHVATAPIEIHDKAWLGFNVIVLKGVVIGEGAIIGAGSVVTKSIPPYTIAAGNPAQVIREIPLNER